jgi:hypothetical protein
METALHDSDEDAPEMVPVVQKIGSFSIWPILNYSGPFPVERSKREPKTRRNMEDVKQAISQIGDRRYLQVYAQCYCEMNRLSSVRRGGSCYPAYKVIRTNIIFNYSFIVRVESPSCTKPAKNFECFIRQNVFANWIGWLKPCGHVFHVNWRCLPHLNIFILDNTWKEHICTECVDLAGHCPMRFLNYRTVGQNGRNRSGLYAIETLDQGLDVCICHRQYNHCVQNNLNGQIPEILPSDALDVLNLTRQIG